MSEAKIKLNEKQPAKKQALEIIKEINSVLPIKRAQMLVYISFKNIKQKQAFEEVKFNEGEFIV